MNDTESKEILDLLTKRLDMAVSADEHNRAEAVDDLRFVNGEQWSSEEIAEREREKRPVLKFNMLPKFIAQVTGDQRQNSPAIKISPASSTASADVAKIRAGKIRDIEYRSNAQRIYDTAFKQTVTCGYGAWRVKTVYKDDKSFDQEVIIAPIANPFMLFSDPGAERPEDKQWYILLERMQKEDFEAMYPDAKQPAGNGFQSGTGATNTYWSDSETVTVAEYMAKVKEQKPICQLSDGRVVEKRDKKRIMEESAAAGIALEVVAERDAESVRIESYICTQSEVLSGPHLWPGSKFLPFVELRGEEIDIEGKSYIRGLIRNAKDPQRMLNFWKTLGAERIALAPKAPFIATQTQVERRLDDWTLANKRNLSVLIYDPDPMAPGPPHRSEVTIPMDVFHAIRGAEEDIEGTIGIFKAGLGAPSNEKSGKAIKERRRESDTLTFTYLDNLTRAIEYTGKVINEIFGEIYSTPQDMRMREPDGTENFVPVNMRMGEAIQRIHGAPEMFKGLDPHKLTQRMNEVGVNAQFNNMNAGEYDAVVTVGPSFATQRMEAAEQFRELIQVAPDIAKIVGDLMLANMDFPQAPRAAARMLKALPSQYKTPEDLEESPEEPQKPPPEVQVKQMEMQLEKEKLQVEREKIEVEKAKVQAEMFKNKQRSDDEIAKVVVRVLQDITSASAVMPLQ